MALDRRVLYATIPQPTLERLPSYLNYLKKRQQEGWEQISSATIAEDLGMTGIQVRKDLAYVSSGKPRTGRSITDLIRSLEDLLGCGEQKDTVLVGAGRLGQALLSYEGFVRYGFNIVMAFDVDEHRIGTSIRGRTVYHADRLQEMTASQHIRYGIIAVTTDQAQTVCDQLASGGVRAVLNFAPVNLSAPDDVIVRNVDIAASMLLLSNTLALQEHGSL